MRKSKDFYEYHYIFLKKTSEQIGREIGVTGRAVRYALKKFGFGEIMRERKKTMLGKSPPNKGKIIKEIPKLGRRYVNIKGKSVAKYRITMEEYLGRKLEKGEVIHHIDGDALNDSIENLVVLSGQKEHLKIHGNPVLKRWSKRIS